jgi:hypothetical protein
MWISDMTIRKNNAITNNIYVVKTIVKNVY